LSAPWIVALDNRGYDSTGHLVEVDNYAQPAPLVQVLAVEALAAGPGVWLAVIGSVDGRKDHPGVGQQSVPVSVLEV